MKIIIITKKKNLKQDCVVLQVQYLGVKPFCYHCLRQILNQSLLLAALYCDYSAAHFGNPAKLGWRTVLVHSEIKRKILVKFFTNKLFK